MKLSEYFEINKFKPTPWAKKNEISPAIISRYLNNGTGVSPKNALKIEKATCGKVTRMELLYPEADPQGD